MELWLSTKNRAPTFAFTMLAAAEGVALASVTKPDRTLHATKSTPGATRRFSARRNLRLAPNPYSRTLPANDCVGSALAPAELDPLMGCHTPNCPARAISRVTFRVNRSAEHT